MGSAFILRDEERRKHHYLFGANLSGILERDTIKL